MNLHTPAPDFSAIKARQQMAWSSGDYAIVGNTLQIVGERLCEAVDVRSNDRVLDVAAGNGNATLAAARHFADVVSTDYVEKLLERGRERAEAERLAVSFQVADAENLPFQDGSFDVVISNGLINLAVDKTKVFKEAARLLRPRGRLALADIVTEVLLPETISCNATLWAACIGGAWQYELYKQAIESAGLTIVAEQVNETPPRGRLARRAARRGMRSIPAANGGSAGRIGHSRIGAVRVKRPRAARRLTVVNTGTGRIGFATLGGAAWSVCPLSKS